MVCIKCGAEMAQDSRFCDQCGTKVNLFSSHNETTNKQKNNTNQTESKKNNKKGNKNKKGFNMFVFLIVLCIIILGLGLGYGIYYVNSSKIQSTYKEISLNDYLNEKGESAYTYLPEGKFQLNLSKDIINTSLQKEVEKIQMPKGMQLNNIYLDLKEEKLHMDLTYLGITYPLVSDVAISIKDDHIILESTELKLGKKEYKLFQIIKKKIPSSLTRMILKIDEVPDVLLMIEAGIEDEQIVLKFLPHVANLQNIIDHYMEEYESLLTKHYKTLENTTYGTDKAYGIIYKKGHIDSHEVYEYVDSFMKDSLLIKESLIFLSDKTIEEIYKDYGHLLSKRVLKEEVYQLKEDYLFEQKIAYSKKLLEYFKDYRLYRQDQVLSFNGSIYDSYMMDFITTDYISEWYGLDKSLSNHMTFYSPSYDEYYVLYQSPLGTIYKINEKSTAQIQAINLEKIYPKEKILTEELLEGIKEAIYNHKEFENKEDIYFRYMKNVEDSAYVIVTSMDQPTAAHGISLIRKEGEWQIIDIDSYYDTINKQYPNFNVFTFPDYTIHKMNLIELSDESQEIFLQELVSKGYYESIDNLYIEFYSYDYDYAYILLNDGKEFIYSIVYDNIEEVYDREKAEETWYIQPGFTLDKRTINE